MIINNGILIDGGVFKDAIIIKVNDWIEWINSYWPCRDDGACCRAVSHGKTVTPSSPWVLA